MPETPLISFVIPCKGRLSHLQQSLPRALAQPDSEVIVVDYDCPDGTAAWVAEHHPDAIVEKVEDQPYFNVSKARNAGLARAAGDWVLFLDADILISLSLVSDVRGRLEKGRYFVFGKDRENGAAGSCLVARDMMLGLGGYDEVFEGYGGEDAELYTRLNYARQKMQILETEPEQVLRHSKAARTEYHPEKNSEKSVVQARLYRIAKRELLKFSRKPQLPRKLLENLYADCGVRVEKAFKNQQSHVRLNLQLPADPPLFDQPKGAAATRRVLQIEMRALRETKTGETP